MAGSEPRLGITWMNMHTQSATNRRRSQEQERDLHAYNPGAGRPEFVQSQSLAPIASKKFGLNLRVSSGELARMLVHVPWVGPRRTGAQHGIAVTWLSTNLRGLPDRCRPER